MPGPAETEDKREGESHGKRKRDGKRDKERLRDRETEEGRGRTERGVQGGGVGRTFSASLHAPLGRVRVAGNQAGRRQVVGQTMARRTAEPGTKFGAAFAGRGAARSSRCKGDTK